MSPQGGNMTRSIKKPSDLKLRWLSFLIKSAVVSVQRRLGFIGILHSLVRRARNQTITKSLTCWQPLYLNIPETFYDLILGSQEGPISRMQASSKFDRTMHIVPRITGVTGEMLYG